MIKGYERHNLNLHSLSCKGGSLVLNASRISSIYLFYFSDNRTLAAVLHSTYTTHFSFGENTNFVTVASEVKCKCNHETQVVEKGDRFEIG
jgi:hypothetical protein